MNGQFVFDDEPLSKEQIQHRAEVIFLAEVVLIIVRLLLVVGEVWIDVLYLLLTIALATAVMQTAFQAARTIPASIPFQRPIGLVLYFSAHVVQILFPGELPIELVAFIMLAFPLSIALLFE